MCTIIYTQVLKDLTGSNADENAGIEAIKIALSSPIRKILENAGIDGASIVEKLLEQNDAKQIYDAQNHEFVDAFKSGIIDPTKLCVLHLKVLHRLLVY